jgi:ABC-2 type transport system ATP-binding protein
MELPSPAAELAEEIRSAVQDDDLSRATKRLLDYAWQFCRGARDVENSARVLIREYKSLEREARILGKSPHYQYQLSALALRILESLDAAEVTARQLLPAEEEPSPPPRSEPRAGEDQAARTGLQTPAASSAKEFLTARNLQKDYGKFALFGIDLTLGTGEIAGVVGVNGSGKTTLLRILAGELAADQGVLRYPQLCGEEIDWTRIRSTIAYVPQRPSRWRGFLQENLHLHAALHHLTGQANKDKVEFILQRLGLESYRNARWHEISAGFQMRFELARALVGMPSLLILDEPLAPLDINTQQLFLQDLRDIANSFSDPLAIVLSSQHVYEVEAIADTIIFLDKGRTIFSGTLEELYAGRKENIYEIASPVRKHDLVQQLESLGAIEVEHAGLTYLVSLPLFVTGRELLELLFAAGIEIRYFRDVSRSTRSLFKGRAGE